ncbi:MAG: delta-60 repeat domain-containing protein, partial [Gammaproteobacteria bacterium]|nr:delta-60 repeat domain-containing protein [Gammaproteobacteria bacterium]
MNRSIKARNCLRQSSLLLLTTLLCAGRAYGAPQGELDATFGENGRLVIQVAGGQFGRAILQQPADGKLLFPGYSNRSDGGNDFAVLRLDSDGTVDGTFGMNGTATVDFGSADAVATRLAVQSDNKILVAGSAGGVLALTRLNSHGAIDSTFGSNGLVTVDLGGVADSLSDITLLANGQFIVLGTTYANGSGDAVFARFGANGVLDTTFGTGPVAGVTIIGVNGKNDELNAMIRQADGKLVACGTTVHIDNGVDYSSDMLAVRVNADGSADGSFGSNGVSQIDDPASHSNAQTCAVMRDGSLMLAGFRGEPGSIK